MHRTTITHLYFLNLWCILKLTIETNEEEEKEDVEEKEVEKENEY